MGDRKLEKMTEKDKSNVPGGSLTPADGGFKLFNSANGEEYGVHSYGRAVELAHKIGVSALGTWGDEQGLKNRREREDKNEITPPIAGFSSGYDDMAPCVTITITR